MLKQPLTFTGCSGIQFFNSPFHLCDLRDAMPLHWLQVLPTQPIPRKTEDFHRSGKYFKHEPLFTYLIYFLLEYNNPALQYLLANIPLY